MVGTRLSHFEITAKIGEGGMGEVYQATDTKLNRKVALKFLPLALQQDESARLRFIREAKAAAAIDHPYICSIYEVGQTEDGQDFIAMEYVAGQTLQEKLAEGPISMDKALPILIEAAEAIEKAHTAGFIHRDLKPANLMLTTEGHVKVMDFGLAKKVVTEEGTEQDISSALTREGATLGTPAYMSPEQVRGQPVDQRSDIFSFGIVLYEMLTGVHPFRKPLSAETISGILNQEPAPLSRYIEKVSELLQHTVKKMLAKDPVQRYQSIHEVRTNLEELLKDTTSKSHPRTLGLKAGYWIIAASVLVLAVVLSYRLFSLPPVSDKPPAFVIPVPITSHPGIEAFPSFSPDGQQVAFMGEIEESGNYDIYVKRIGSEVHLRRTDDPARDVAPAWSPDGRWIAFIRLGTTDDEEASIRLIEPHAGREREVGRVAEVGRLHRVTRPSLTWTPDSQGLIVTDLESSNDIAATPFLLSIDTGERHRLTDPSSYKGDVSPSLSPDGRTLAFVRTSSLNSGNLWLLSLADDFSPVGEPWKRTSLSRFLTRPAWTSDSEDVIFSAAAGDQLDASYLWRVERSGTGEPEPLLFAGEGSIDPAVSRRGDRLAYTHFGQEVNIYQVDVSSPGGLPSEPVKLISSTHFDGYPQDSPDGTRIAFASNRSGTYEIWACDRDGTNPSRLTTFGNRSRFGSAIMPEWSPDGTAIAFEYREGESDIYVVGSQGGAARRLTSNPNYDGTPRWSRDGKWVYFGSLRSGKREEWKVSLNTGQGIPVPANGWRLHESADGKTIYFNKESVIWSMSSDGSEETKILEDAWLERVVDSGLYYLKETTDSVTYYFLEFETGESRMIGAAPFGRYFAWHSLAPDNRSILYHNVDRVTADIMLVENFSEAQ